MTPRKAHQAFTWCAACGASHLATMIPVPGGWDVACPVAGRAPYAATLPVADPPVMVLAPPRLRPATPPRAPRPVGRPRKSTP